MNSGLLIGYTAKISFPESNFQLPAEWSPKLLTEKGNIQAARDGYPSLHRVRDQ